MLFSASGRAVPAKPGWVGVMTRACRRRLVPTAPDLVALAVPAAGLALLAAVVVIAETRLLRRRGVPGLLRIGV
jgi:hypothetical protein